MNVPVENRCQRSLELLEALVAAGPPVNEDYCLMCLADAWYERTDRAVFRVHDLEDPSDHAPHCPWRIASQFLNGGS